MIHFKQYAHLQHSVAGGKLDFTVPYGSLNSRSDSPSGAQTFNCLLTAPLGRGWGSISALLISFPHLS